MTDLLDSHIITFTGHKDRSSDYLFDDCVKENKFLIHIACVALMEEKEREGEKEKEKGKGRRKGRGRGRGRKRGPDLRQ